VALAAVDISGKEEVFMRAFRWLVRVVTLVGSFAALTGCATNVPFEFFQEGYKPKGRSLAVVSGGTDEAGIKFAEHLTTHLQQKSTLKVMSQAEVDRRVGKYPVNIKTAAPKDEDKPVWFAPGEKAKVDAMHGALKTDYVLVVWVSGLNRFTSTSSTGGTRVSYGAWLIGNLVEYSPGKAVGYADFGRSKSQSCFLFGGSEGKDIDELLRGSAEDMAEELAERTGTERK
jgi:hypothetical protein